MNLFLSSKIFESFILVSILIRIKEIECIAPYALNMYNTDIEMYNEVEDGYCLYYYTHTEADVEYSVQHHLYSYCIRSSDYLKTGSTGIKSSISFSTLREQHITVDQLFLWSTPIDVIERYKMYLMNISILNSKNDSQHFYNCTWPLFGPVCQFRFTLVHNSFYNLIYNSMRESFRSNENELLQIKSSRTCYIHLKCDYISPLPMCLSWREICDGKIHCLNNGIDEQNCFQLELNQCDENKEYRCHNGQCIPYEFFEDNSANPDCLDRTDEIIDYYSSCYTEPTMRCEDHICRPGPLNINCGDGECHDLDCRNGKIERWELSLISKPRNLPFSLSCWNAISCLAQIHVLKDEDECSNYDTWNRNVKIIRQNCSSIFIYPSYPVALGHIYFVYRNNQSYLYNQPRFALPTYICYNEQFCPFFSSSSLFPSPIYLSINSTTSFTCHYFSSLPIIVEKKIIMWQQLQKAIENLYLIACLKFDQIYENIEKKCESYSQLYLCKNSTKCISKYRILDGIIDCPMEDDETYEDSCSLTTIHQQFQCLINGINKCVSPILFYNEKYRCINKLTLEDIRNPIIIQPKFDADSSISFQTLCDGFEERHPLLINNQSLETDETNCDYNIWPCNNTYTHCDNYWNCQNGFDELNCPLLFDKKLNYFQCQTYEHICISPLDYSLGCLNLSRINDNIIDCLGATDERYFCRNMYNDSSFRYRCYDDSQCIHPTGLCDDYHNCLHNDDEDMCWKANGLNEEFNNVYPLLCTPLMINKNLIAHILCYLNELNKPNIVHFSLKGSTLYPKTIFINKTTLSNNHMNKIMKISKSIEIDDGDDEEEFGPYRRPCNRGLPINIRHGKNNSFEEQCLCPPTYYGSHCQYENDRVALTIQFRVEFEWRTVFSFIILLIDNNETIHSYEKLSYLSIRDCNAKFHIYLLYKSRFKNMTHKYYIRIHGFVGNSSEYRTSWLYPIKFQFLPVHRMSIQLNIPRISKKDQCLIDCGIHGDCIEYENNQNIFCRCHSGWNGIKCNIKYQCQCSNDSFCIESSNICLCPLNKYGSRCYLEQSVCKQESKNSLSLCLNGGICIPFDIRYVYHKNKSVCICPENFFGNICEYEKSRIELSFTKDISIFPSSVIFTHFIIINDKNKHKMMTILSKIRFDQTNLVLYTFIQFNIILVNTFNNYYLVAVIPQYEYFYQLKLSIQSSQRCLHINELFNKTIVDYHPLRRAKYYHLACKKILDLKCFYDSDTFMCLCNVDYHANCFNFNYNFKYDCQGNNYCLNNGQCFQDKLKCPTMSVCACTDCFYGTLCQFSSEGLRLSLDSILGYHIQSQLSIYYQSNIVKISFAIVISMFILGFISSFCSMITFMFTPTSRNVGCGIYLLTLSIINLLIIHAFLAKFLLLLFIQNETIIQQWILKGNCILTDYILRVLVNIADWLNACVAIERTLTVAMGVHFIKSKSKKVSKWIILMVIVISFLTAIQDPLNRYLIYVEEDEKTWCVIHYNSRPLLKQIDSTLNLIHFIIPFLINLISSFIIVLLTARMRTTAHKGSFLKNMRKQLRQHYHLIVSSCLLVILALPRIILSLYNGCMKSANDPRLPLSGYFVSFVPTVLIFMVFVLPSDKYRNDFKQVICRLKMAIIKRRMH